MLDEQPETPKTKAELKAQKKAEILESGVKTEADLKKLEEVAKADRKKDRRGKNRRIRQMEGKTAANPDVAQPKHIHEKALKAKRVIARAGAYKKRKEDAQKGELIAAKKEAADKKRLNKEKEKLGK